MFSCLKIAMENGDTVLAALLPAHANDDLESKKPADAASDARRLASTASAAERTSAAEGSVADATASMLSYRKEAPQKWNFNAVTHDVLEALKSGTSINIKHYLPTKIIVLPLTIFFIF